MNQTYFVEGGFKVNERNLFQKGLFDDMLSFPTKRNKYSLVA